MSKSLTRQPPAPTSTFAAIPPGPPVHVVIIDLDANDAIDITSSDCLNKLADSLDRDQIRLALAHVHQPALVIARRAGLLDRIGDDRVFPNIPTALAWANRNQPPG